MQHGGEVGGTVDNSGIYHATTAGVLRLQNAREIVRWAYGTAGKETAIGDVSEVFDMGDQYVIAVLTGERS